MIDPEPSVSLIRYCFLVTALGEGWRRGGVWRQSLVGLTTFPSKPRLPWQNGRGEGFNARLRDDLLNGEAFYSLREARSSSKMEETLRYQTTSQCIVLPPTGARNDRANGVQANHALTFKPGHLGSANQKPKQRQHVRTDNLRAEFFGLKELINDE